MKVGPSSTRPTYLIASAATICISDPAPEGLFSSMPRPTRWQLIVTVGAVTAARHHTARVYVSLLILFLVGVLRAKTELEGARHGLLCQRIHVAFMSIMRR